MTTNIVKVSKLNASEFKLSQNIKVNKFQGKSVYASYKNTPVRLQLPKLSLPFGISKYVNPESNDIKYSLDISLKDMDQSFFDCFDSIEETVLDYAEKNSVELFKKKRSKDILREFYKPFIKHFEDENGERSDKYPPRFKSKLWLNGNDFTMDVFDSVKVDGSYPKIKLNLDNADDVISAGSHCEAIIQCSGLWVVGDSFGISWSTVQIKIYKNENSISGYAFQDDSDDEDSDDGGFDEEDLEEPVVVVSTPVETRQKRTRRKKEDL